MNEEEVGTLGKPILTAQEMMQEIENEIKQNSQTSYKFEEKKLDLTHNTTTKEGETI